MVIIDEAKRLLLEYEKKGFYFNSKLKETDCKEFYKTVLVNNLPIKIKEYDLTLAFAQQVIKRAKYKEIYGKINEVKDILIENGHYNEGTEQFKTISVISNACEVAEKVYESKMDDLNFDKNVSSISYFLGYTIKEENGLISHLPLIEGSNQLFFEKFINSSYSKVSEQGQEKNFIA